MPVDAGRSGLLARFFGWIVRTLSGSGAGRSGPDSSLLLPGVFLSRAPVPVSARPFPDASAQHSPVSSQDWAFAARLRSVSVHNVPKALKGPRRRISAPAGKAIPKHAPRVLKRYKPSGGALVTAARANMARLSSLRASNVIDLADAVRRRLGGMQILDQKRAA